MFSEGLVGALRLIFTGDARVYGAAFTSVWIAATSTTIASALGLPLGFALAAARFRGREFAITILNTLLALPTVVVGLFVYGLIRRGSILGPLDLLFTPGAMIVGQVVLALPIVAALSHSAFASLGPAPRETAVLLGASRARVCLTMVTEARRGLLAAAAAAGGRLIGEVGISMMLGGNIAGYTRNLTTAIALETAKGEFAFGMALGIVLLALALGANFLLRRLRGREEAAP
ncbi:MAG: ABC transporter permease [Planctomycetota bacterium]|jgi:tungstate transport system permease protein